MNKKQFYKSTSAPAGRLFKGLAAFALATLLSGCYLTAAVRDYQNGAGTPWWCQGAPSLNQNDCLLFSLQLDVAEKNARLYPTLADFQAAGAVNFTSSTPPDTGEAYTLPTADYTTFNPNKPQVLLYDGTAPTSRLVGVMWWSNTLGAPPGFPDTRDVWISSGGGWALPAWIIRGYHNHGNVFAASHPCLVTGVSYTSTTSACFVASHTLPFEVLVSNDDGVMAEGIDVLVEALYTLPNTTVHVVAPAENQSGSSDNTTPPPYVVSGAATTTLSGRPATAVYSTDPADPFGSGSPADSVIFALGNLYLSPELVLSGMNEGQNYTTIGHGLSGTVGAARTGRRQGVPAIATSQGLVTGLVTDFPTGAVATMALIEQWRLGKTLNGNQTVLNINIPTCVGVLTPRGTLNTVVKPAPIVFANYGIQDCASVEPIGNIDDDMEAFNHGFIGIANMGTTQPPNWP